MSNLVLSLFPGIGMLDHAFEREGFVVVRGPDILWGGDIRKFSPPIGVFDGVIGGPPCPSHSRLKHQITASGYIPADDLVCEFERVVALVAPRWFMMENAPACREPVVDGYQVDAQIFDNHNLDQRQGRRRLIAYGTVHGARLHLSCAALITCEREHVVTSDARPVPVAIGGSGKRKPGADLPKRSVSDCLELQGFPRAWLDDCPLTVAGKRKAVGNGVPLPMGREIAKAVKRAQQEMR